MTSIACKETRTDYDSSLSLLALVMSRSLNEYIWNSITTITKATTMSKIVQNIQLNYLRVIIYLIETVLTSHYSIIHVTMMALTLFRI